MIKLRAREEQLHPCQGITFLRDVSRGFDLFVRVLTGPAGVGVVNKLSFGVIDHLHCTPSQPHQLTDNLDVYSTCLLYMEWRDDLIRY